MRNGERHYDEAGSRWTEQERPSYYRERPILGPCRCQGCMGEVVYYVRDDGKYLGWLHVTGSYRCFKPGPRRVLS